jgi:mycofactocin system creatininase family protein
VNELNDLTWPQVEHRAERGGILLIPVGSTEQHGPHLPLTTDTDIAVAVARGAAQLDPRVVVAPAVAYGSSGEHQAFAGTLSIGSDVTEAVLVELGRSASVAFARVLVGSTHGGNATPVARAMAQLHADGHPVKAWWPAWPGDLHAGRTETSLMLAIAPDRVRLEQAEAGDQRPIRTLLPVLVDHGVRAVSANGVLGDPTGATSDEGARLLASAVADLAEMIREIDGEP